MPFCHHTPGKAQLATCHRTRKKSIAVPPGVRFFPGTALSALLSVVPDIAIR